MNTEHWILNTFFQILFKFNEFWIYFLINFNFLLKCIEVKIEKSLITWIKSKNDQKFRNLRNEQKESDRRNNLMKSQYIIFLQILLLLTGQTSSVPYRKHYFTSRTEHWFYQNILISMLRWQPNCVLSIGTPFVELKYITNKLFSVSPTNRTKWSIGPPTLNIYIIYIW